MVFDTKPSGKKRTGRPSRSEQLGLRLTLDKCFPQEDRESCINALVRMAKKGDREAIKILLAYTYGKPPETTEHAGKVEIVLINESSYKSPHSTS